MHSTVQKSLTIIICGILLYFLVYPFVNSLLSGRFYLKVNSEGSMTTGYIAEVDKDLTITAHVENYNNVATEKQGSTNLGPFKNNITQETYEKIKSIISEYQGFHIFVRRHTGYAYYYDSNSAAATFYNNNEKTKLLEFAQTLVEIARGDEKVDTKRSSETYESRGLDHLNKIYADLGL